MVDLFAGCGGLSLGLENVGFHPIRQGDYYRSVRGRGMSRPLSVAL